jgi:hypothetical protein
MDDHHRLNMVFVFGDRCSGVVVQVLLEQTQVMLERLCNLKQPQ